MVGIPPSDCHQHHILDKLQDRDGAIVRIRAGLHGLFDLDHLESWQMSTPKLVDVDRETEICRQRNA